jgi:hypothetical protein
MRHATAVLALAAMLLPSPVRSQDIQLQKEMDQGWTAAQRDVWYSATQGSRLIPLAWMRSLEQPGQANPPKLFLEPAYIASFGYLPRSSTASGPLPVGFVVDRGPDKLLKRTALRWKEPQGDSEPWLGLTCSACHTTQLTHKGRALRIEGGPSISNFQNFIRSFNRALVETRDEPQKWERFARRVLGNQDQGKLKSAFRDLVEWETQELRANHTELAYGPGRIDAFGHIYNKVALLLGGATAKGNPSDAPVSIPFIWRAPQLDRVQYNGIARKILVLGNTLDVGALGRNTGEVIGVFGDVVPNKNPGVFSGFSSSVKVQSLIRLEQVLSSLRPPAWPASVFGKPGSSQGVVSQAKLDRGRDLYDKNCLECHERVSRRELTKVLDTQMSLFDGSGKHTKTKKDLLAPGTDPWMACNAFDYKADAGPLTGLESSWLTDGKPVPAEHGLGDLLRITVSATLLDNKGEIIKETAARLIGIKKLPVPELESAPVPPPPGRSAEKQARLVRCFTSKHPNLGYTSRPLNGVWATAPFLHNGSVPTMYDLLLPPSQRPKSFYLGTREYDPVKLGFVTDKTAVGNVFEFKTGDAANPIDGNSNEGHDYSNDKLTDDDRYAIIEYLKTL